VDGSFVLTHVRIRRLEAVPVARPAGKPIEVRATVAVFGTVVVPVVGTELFGGGTTVGRGDLRRPIDVLTELGVYLIGVGPLRYRTCASGESDTTDVFAPDFSVLVVGTRTPALTSVHMVF